MSMQQVNTQFLRKVRVGQSLKNREGKRFKVVAIYNQNTAAQQFLLEGEHYPHLLAELVKLGYTLQHGS